jgi:toxin YoeB
VLLLWTPKGWDDYVCLQSAEPEIIKKINDLIKEIRRDHFRGPGKPEALEADFQGWWSRRITGEHRLVYRITGKEPDKQLEIAKCRFRYRRGSVACPRLRTGLGFARVAA